MKPQLYIKANSVEVALIYHQNADTGVDLGFF